MLLHLKRDKETTRQRYKKTMIKKDIWNCDVRAILYSCNVLYWYWNMSYSYEHNAYMHDHTYMIIYAYMHVIELSGQQEQAWIKIWLNSLNKSPLKYVCHHIVFQPSSCKIQTFFDRDCGWDSCWWGHQLEPTATNEPQFWWWTDSNHWTVVTTELYWSLLCEVSLKKRIRWL